MRDEFGLDLPRRARRHVRERERGFWRGLPGTILVSVLVALLIKSFLVQVFYIPSESMTPTLAVGDRVLVNKLARRPERGDVIVFRSPFGERDPDRGPLSAVWHWLIEGLGIGRSAETDFIKRVIALPGETVEVRGGHVYVDGRELAEPYARLDTDDMEEKRVPPDSVWVMGDNRANSTDSRVFGPIARDRILGEAVVVIWPPADWGGLRGG